MQACTKCGHWHSNAEHTMGRSLSCTEVKRFWVQIKEEHRVRYGHTAQISRDDHGILRCFTCKREIILDGSAINLD